MIPSVNVNGPKIGMFGYGPRTRKSPALVVGWMAVLVAVFLVTWYLTAGRSERLGEKMVP